MNRKNRKIHLSCIGGVCNNVRLLLRHFFAIMRVLWQSNAASGHISTLLLVQLFQTTDKSKWVKSFCQHGNALYKNSFSRVPTDVIFEYMNRVRMSFEGSPGRSTRRRALVLETSRSIPRIITQKHLLLHPYLAIIVQKLLPHYPVQHLQLSEHILNILQDEAHFHLDDHVDKQNCRYRAKENPRELHQAPLYIVKKLPCAVL